MKWIFIALYVLIFPATCVFAEEMDHSHMNMGADDHDMAMSGMYGNYAMTREASGTSWQPESSPMDSIHQGMGDWSTMIHGFANAIYDHQGGPRGDSKTFSTSMLMLMGQRPLGDGTLGLRSMVSLDPLMGKSGYPLLLQTGETADGHSPLVDRQHPHDLFMELAVTYSMPLANDSSVFVYAGLPGEPALGPPAFMHRISGIDNPEAPIAHHWLDSTHITYGVLTGGYVLHNWKLEASAFRGREPDQFRYNIDTGKLDSSSLRLSYNPAPNWATQISYGRIKSPEALEPDIDVRRTTVSISYNRPFESANWQTLAAWGRNTPNIGDATSAYLLESALTLNGRDTFFGRVERVGKNELFDPGNPLFGRTFKVDKASLGYVHDFASQSHFRFGVGGLVSKYSLPGDLAPSYGGNPASVMFFVRVKLQ